jgi:hypothetical protein
MVTVKCLQLLLHFVVKLIKLVFKFPEVVEDSRVVMTCLLKFDIRLGSRGDCFRDVLHRGLSGCQVFLDDDILLSREFVYGFELNQWPFLLLQLLKFVKFL